MICPFEPGERVRVLDNSPASASKRKPSFPRGAEVVVAKIADNGEAVSLVGHAGYWRIERFGAV